MPKIIDKTGRKYGHWVVIGLDAEKKDTSRQKYWICECDCGCGTRKSIRADSLANTIIGGCKNAKSLEETICEKCGKAFNPKRFAKQRKYCYECLPEENYNGATMRKVLKKWALQEKGKKCCVCGYNKCIEALEFHHLNPNEKDFNLSDRNIKLDWNKVKQEIDKCILVCSNCHREIHSGVLELKGDDFKNG